MLRWLAVQFLVASLGTDDVGVLGSVVADYRVLCDQLESFESLLYY